MVGAFSAWARRHNIVSMFPVAQRHLAISLKRLAILNQARMGLQQKKRAMVLTPQARSLHLAPPVGSLSSSARSCAAPFAFPALGQFAPSPLCRASLLVQAVVRIVVRFWVGRHHPRPTGPGLHHFRAQWAHHRSSYTQQHHCWLEGGRPRSPFASAFASFGQFSGRLSRTFCTTSSRFFTPSALPSLASAARAGPAHRVAAFSCKASELALLQRRLGEETSARVPGGALPRLGLFRSPRRTPQAPLGLTRPFNPTGNRPALWGVRSLTTLLPARPPAPEMPLPDLIYGSAQFEPVIVQLEISIVSAELSPVFSPEADTTAPATVLAKLRTAQALQEAHLCTVTRMVEQLADTLPCCQLTTRDSCVVVNFPPGLARRYVERMLRSLGIDPSTQSFTWRESPLTPAPSGIPETQCPRYPNLDLALSVYSSTDSSSSGIESWMDQTVPTLLLEQLATPPTGPAEPTPVDDFMFQLDQLVSDRYTFGPRCALSH
ncbi:hypothetical protein H4R33_000056 [Dimargaris cristalligena]|uniref:Uncharacterized protein n=1 Tax=Dimargaris cristalligena TaxID=215637 RepID=A0A4P9ZR94_9FUNG|nr:hypothetical protein H4R33_000056 [Dimargaris cristalligena]RKP35172.1 hypothetical protein BJ085DRAFT_36184 [Dimargaris cristalligena]|eukprot:RKP35172.1 hypothetical protein BJ085DRAFT_36184 [Dimargaris cristalligena]